MKNLKRQLRAQSALEYLFMYGWGIGIVAVVVAVLVLLNNSSLVNSGSFGGFKQNWVVNNVNYPVSGAAPLEFLVSNTSGRALRFSGLKVKYNQAELGGATQINGSFVGQAPVTVLAGEKKRIGFYSTSEWFRGPLNLSVDFAAVDPDGFSKNGSGNVSFTAVNGSGCPQSSCIPGTKQCNTYLANSFETCVTVLGCNVWGPPAYCSGGAFCYSGMCV